jgi:hypothetical protein
MAKITGIVKWASDVQTGTSQAGNDWQRQEIMVHEIVGEYPQSVVLTLMGDRIEKFSEYVRTPKVGTFHFAMEAHEYNGRYWNSMRLYRVDSVGVQQTQQPASAPAETQGTHDDNDGLPF